MGRARFHTASAASSRFYAKHARRHMSDGSAATLCSTNALKTARTSALALFGMPLREPPPVFLPRAIALPAVVSRKVRYASPLRAERVQELFDQVAKKDPAKALDLLAKMSEFVVPRLYADAKRVSRA